MSYLVLARKYRPRSFASLVGQEHTVRILTNALNNTRLHHAYLFTGSHGIGKTTIARILAKCLNCEAKITATPCGNCVSCRAIDGGYAVDLIEIDAASNTKVEDTRQLLNNVQYAPTQDRFKIYLIDEVHMLSGHSFNALLKTLEEPPAHVKFILATTDPQKLPVTVLSRCLQFHLKNMSPELIAAQLQAVCTQENVVAEPLALVYLAENAGGSMRDALSLLDQAIAYADGQLTATDVQTMLGTVQSSALFDLLRALAQQDGMGLMQGVADLINQGADCEQILSDLLSLLHRITLAQLVPAIVNQNSAELANLLVAAQSFSKEHLQLLYQIALIGRRDIQFAASPRSGLEMILLRMLSFAPEISTLDIISKPSTPIALPEPIKPQPVPAAIPAQASLNWQELIQQLNLNGLMLATARHCELQSISDDIVSLQIDPSHTALINDKQQHRLQELLTAYFGKPMQLKIAVLSTLNSPVEQQQRLNQTNRDSTLVELENDPNVKKIMSKFSAKMDPDSIKPPASYNN